MLNTLKKHRGKIIVAFIVMAVVGIIITRRTIFKPQPDYETAAVTIGDIKKTLEVSGEINAETKATLRFQTPGRLSWVGVKEGDKISKWQAVASLDKSILRKQLSKYLDDYMHQRWDFDEIREKNLVTTDNYDEYSFSNSIERAIEQEQFLLNKTISDVEIQDITNRWATLVSPIPGVVTSIDTPVAGVNVSTTDAFTIVDPGSLYFEVEIDEGDLGQVKIGQPVVITLESFPDQPISSTIQSINFTGSESTSGGVVFTAKVGLPTATEQFRLGMTGDATITLEEKYSILLIPSEAVVEKDDRTFVKVIIEKMIQEKEVTIGIEGETKTEIISGLNDNEVVIVGEAKKKK